MTDAELAGMILSLQDQGCHNINLVLPYDLAGTRNVMQFIFKSISHHTYVNVMSQYRPCGRAHEISALSRAGPLGI